MKTTDPLDAQRPPSATTWGAWNRRWIRIVLWAILILVSFQVIALGVDAISGSTQMGDLAARVAAFLLYVLFLMRTRGPVLAQAVALFVAVQILDNLAVLALSGTLHLDLRAIGIGFAIWLPALVVSMALRHLTANRRDPR